MHLYFSLFYRSSVSRMPPLPRMQTIERPTLGYVFFANAPISWSAHNQSVVALPTVEAEYLALSDAEKEAFCHTKVLLSIGFQILHLIPIHADSESGLQY